MGGNTEIAIGELSRRTRSNVETIRYYERIGLLPKPRREKGGRFRRYDGDDVARLRFIRRADSLASRSTRFASYCGWLLAMMKMSGRRSGALLRPMSRKSTQRSLIYKRWSAF